MFLLKFSAIIFLIFSFVEAEKPSKHLSTPIRDFVETATIEEDALNRIGE